MPAERVRHSKRSANAAHDVSLTTTLSVDISAAAAAAHSIAFAPNVTPGTFNDPPSSMDSTSAESLLFPASAEGGAGPRRAAHAKKKPENHIPRPPNAFILFRSSFIKNQHVSSEVETNHSTLSKIIGLTWQNLPHEERQVWHAKAKAALEEHKRKFPQYAFRPLHTKAKGQTEKRKVREVEPKDLKRCAKIAQLLIEGKKGTDLDAAIQEFDRHHVPEVVTRFEAPITARHYRRSSSAPVPQTEHSDLPFLKVEEELTTPTRMSKVRSSSSQPDAPCSPAYECTTPSPPSEADTDTDFYSSPSSPYIPTTQTYALPPTNPSFVSAASSTSVFSGGLADDKVQDFSTFSFDSTPNPMGTTPFPACDPLDQQNAYEVFSTTQESHESCVSPSDLYNHGCLTIDTSFMDSWTASSSPLSSMPGTPQTYSAVQTPCDPIDVLDNYLPRLGDVYDPSADFLPQQGTPLYPESVPTYCTPSNIDMVYGTQEFGGMPPKGDFSTFYGRQAMEPVDTVFVPTYLTALPTFAI